MTFFFKYFGSPYHNFLIDDHLANYGMNSAVWQLKHVRQLHQGDGVIYMGVGEQVGAQALLLDLPTQHLPHTVCFMEQVPHLGIHLVIQQQVSLENGNTFTLRLLLKNIPLEFTEGQRG